MWSSIVFFLQIETAQRLNSADRQKAQLFDGPLE
jgi:hypothetical protein